MKDVQSQTDNRSIYLKQVGIKNYHMPLVVKDRKSGSQHTVATVHAAVDLAHDTRGAHMSRFVAVLNEIEAVNYKGMEKLLYKLAEKLDSEEAFIEMQFDYFIKKTAPVSKIESMLNVNCVITAYLKENQFDFRLSVTTPITTLCPCSKEISEAGAHNQRALVTLTVHTKEFIWIEDLVSIAERSASCPIFSLLKRPDEKYVTEYAYNHPKFVEDVARDCAVELEKLKGISYYKAEAESIESIHNHSAYAFAEKTLE